jgi:hypothetical protein
MFSLDFTIPNLFSVKGKIGAYENLMQKPRATPKFLTKWTAVVTGGGSGIGTMIASAYVQNGAKVYIASRKEEQLKEVSRWRGTDSHRLVIHYHQTD